MAMTLAKYAALESGFLATHARAALQAIQELTDVLSEEVVSDLQASTVQADAVTYASQHLTMM
eukprot:gene2101-18160_t